MKKRIAALMLAATLLAACGSSGTSSSTPAAGGAAGGEGGEDFSGVELSFWTAPFGDNDAEFFAEHLADWEARTGAKVNVEIIPWDNYEEKYMTGVASGTGPDVGYMYNEMLYNYIESGSIEPLDSYFTEEEKASYIYWDNGNVLGEQYILPYVVGAPRILFANMDLLAEAGYDAIPTTWDELVEVATAVKEATGKIGFDVPWGGYFGDLNEIYFPYLWQAGGDICDDEGNLTLDTDAALKATEFVYSLKTSGVISSSCVSRDSSAVTDDFKAGEVAMFVISSVNADEFTQAGINWDYIPFTTDVTGGTMVANDSLVLMSASKNKEAAVSLMKELTSIEMMEAFHAECYQMPPISEGEEYLDDPKFESMYTEYADQFHALPVMKNFSQIESALYANLQQMMMDEMTPEQVLQSTMEYTASLS